MFTKMKLTNIIKHHSLLLIALMIMSMLVILVNPIDVYAKDGYHIEKCGGCKSRQESTITTEYHSYSAIGTVDGPTDHCTSCTHCWGCKPDHAIPASTWKGTYTTATYTIYSTGCDKQSNVNVVSGWRIVAANGSQTVTNPGTSMTFTCNKGTQVSCRPFTGWSIGSAPAPVACTHGGTTTVWYCDGHETANEYYVSFLTTDSSPGNAYFEGSMGNQTHTYDKTLALSSNAFRSYRKVTFNANNGVFADNTSVKEQKAYFTFNSWYRDNSANNGVFTDKQSVSNLTIENKGKVNLYAQFNPTPASVTMSTPTRVGYIFDGWYIGNTPVTLPYVPTTKDTTITAHWKPIVYTVSYQGNGGTSGTTATSSHTYDVAKNLTPNAFDRRYTVTYNANDGNSVTKATLPKTQDAIIYTFKNWQRVDDANQTFTNGQSVLNLTSVNNADVKLKAIWNVPIHTFPTPTRRGYTFKGWNQSASATTGVTTATVGATGTWYAIWEKNTYTLTINNDNATGSGTTQLSVKYDDGYYSGTTKITSISVPSRVGYLFEGYYTGVNGGGAKIIDSSGKIIVGTDYFASNTTIYAKWKPITYYVDFNSNTALNGGNADTKLTNTYTFSKNYVMPPKPFTNVSKGYYGQDLTWNFIGWSWNKYGSLANTNTKAPYLLKDGLLLKQSTAYQLINQKTGEAARANATYSNNIYYYNKSPFSNLTTTNGATLTLYAQWIPENQRPYCGFTLRTLEYRDDGTKTGKLVHYTLDSYDANSYTDVAKTIDVYDDAVYYLTPSYRDPEGNSCTVEYQYSIDGGQTWYRLSGMTGNKASTHFTAETKNINGTTLIELSFKKDKTTLIRMRALDTIDYASYIPEEGASPITCQKPMYSTGYVYDSSIQQYDSNDKYLGDKGSKLNQGGNWYVKTLNGKKGNTAPTADLVGPDAEIPSGKSYSEIVNTLNGQKYYSFPMYDYTKSGETWNYTTGNTYLLVSKDLGNAYSNNTTNIANYVFKNSNNYKNLKLNFIEERYQTSTGYQYTTFNPEHESIAFINISTDIDKPNITNNDFSHFFIAICEKGTTKDVLGISTDKATTYSGTTTSSKTLYTMTYNGTAITGHIYNTYEEMVKDIYQRSGCKFASISDVDLSVYDVYFAVCDKAKATGSPNRWSTVKKKSLVVEPELTIYDVTLNNKTSINNSNKQDISIFKDFYRLSGYTQVGSNYYNVDQAFNNGTNTTGTMLTRYNNSIKNYVERTSGTNYVSKNNSYPVKYGSYINSYIRTHGAETIEISFYDDNNNKIGIIPNKTASTIGTLSEINKTMTMTNIPRKNTSGTQFYTNSLLSFAIPEQCNSKHIDIKITVKTKPYTNPNTTIVREISLANIIGNNGSMYDDIGIDVNN